MLETNAIEELETMFAKLFVTAQKLPPSPDRHETPKEIGLMRQRLDAIAKTPNVGINTRVSYPLPEERTSCAT